MAQIPKKLFLLDAYALIYRAHFAFTKNPRINSKGRNTSVPFGFTNTLLEVITKQQPTHLGVAFDTAAPTFRDALFTDYKATRQETPEDVRYGLPICKEIIRAFNIPILELDGYEADDIIGTLAARFAGPDCTVYMMTPDKDYGQLVQPNALLYKPAYMGNSVDILGPAEVCARWEIENVQQVVDILGLQGDASDNIPGIPGVGPKTAAELIRRFGTVEEVVAHAAELKGKLRERVEQFGQQALLSKQLATIRLDVPMEVTEEQLRYTAPDEPRLRAILDELEFKSMLPRVFASAAPTPQTVSRPAQLSMFEAADTPANAPAPEVKKSFVAGAVDYRVAAADQRAGLLDKLLAEKEMAVELIAAGRPDTPAALAVAVAPGQAFYVPLSDAGDLNFFQPVWQHARIGKVGHQLKATLLLAKAAHLETRGPLFDTTVAHYLIEPEASHDFATLCKQYLGYDLLPPDSDPVQAACERADLTLQLRHRLQAELENREHALLMRDVEMPLLYVLSDMEWEGVKIDEAALRQMGEQLRKDSEQLQKEIYDLAGAEFNIGSPKQLGEVLFDRLKLQDKVKKTKTGQYATGEEVLLKLAPGQPIVQKILDWREQEKLRSTYVEALPRMIAPRDGRVHTDYRQAVAATGRLSSNNPNLQNIPIRTPKGRQIRRAFVPRSAEYRFMSADYSQIELRIAAAFAQDETMTEAFRLGRDIHATTAAKVFRTPLENVTPDMRRKAKEVNFGILYGSTAFGLAQNLNIPKTEAAAIIESYFREFPGIKRYMDDAINFAREKEYVETILGRRRYLRDINSRNLTTRGFAERNAINAPIQGSAADIIKIAMVHIQHWLKKEKLKTRMILQVHDELIFDLHAHEEEVVKQQVKHLMQHAVQLDVPMEVEVGVGPDWLSAH
jgi:DNA polymerase-1